MNYGLATIVNAHGSLTDLPDDAVVKLADRFQDEELAEALQSLRDDPTQRRHLGERSREIIRTMHAPRRCADRYAHAIEQTYHDYHHSPAIVIPAVAQLDPGPEHDADLVGFSQALTQCLPPRLRLPQRLVEIDPGSDARSAAVAGLAQRLREPVEAYRVEPVYLDKEGRYRYARQYALQLLGCPAKALTDEVAEIHHGDTFVALPHDGDAARVARLQDLQRRGVLVLSGEA